MGDANNTSMSFLQISKTVGNVNLWGFRMYNYHILMSVKHIGETNGVWQSREAVKWHQYCNFSCLSDSLAALVFILYWLASINNEHCSQIFHSFNHRSKIKCIIFVNKWQNRLVSWFFQWSAVNWRFRLSWTQLRMSKTTILAILHLLSQAGLENNLDKTVLTHSGVNENRECQYKQLERKTKQLLENPDCRKLSTVWSERGVIILR